MRGNLKRLLLRFKDGNKQVYTDGDWKIAVGGYDLWFEVYYQGIPKIQCVAGNVSICNDRDIDARKCLNTIKEVFPVYKIDLSSIQ